MFEFARKITAHFQKNKSSASSVPLRLLTSPGRSGFHWLKFMLAHTMQKPPLEERLLEPEALKAALQHKAHDHLCYEHLDIERHGFILDETRYPDLKMVLLYRHPLDILVSSFFFLASKKMLLFPEKSPVENMRLYIRNAYELKMLPQSLQETWMISMGYKEYLRRLVVDWLKTGRVYGVRYEELVKDTPKTLKKILSYYQVSCSRHLIKEAVKQNRFEVLSGGRDRGTEDVASHYRKGISGDWKSFFNQEDLAVVKKEFGAELDWLNYSIS